MCHYIDIGAPREWRKVSPFQFSSYKRTVVKPEPETKEQQGRKKGANAMPRLGFRSRSATAVPIALDGRWPLQGDGHGTVATSAQADQMGAIAQTRHCL